MYADDTTLLVSHNQLADLFLNCNSALNFVISWFEDNRLCINVAKTNYMLFTHSIKNPNLFNVVLNDIVVERRSSVKFLGVILDDKLNWKEHIKCISIKLAHDVAMLKIGNYCLPKSCLYNLYFAFFYSHMTYALPLWCNAGIVVLDQINVLQRRAIKIIAGLYLFMYMLKI